MTVESKATPTKSLFVLWWWMDGKTHNNTLTSKDSTETAARRNEREELAGVGAAGSFAIAVDISSFLDEYEYFTIRMELVEDHKEKMQ